MRDSRCFIKQSPVAFTLLVLGMLFCISCRHDLKDQKKSMEGTKITTKFRDVVYEAKVSKGGLAFDELGQLAFVGIVTGKQAVENAVYPKWHAVKPDLAHTMCRILDYDEVKGILLVDGDVERNKADAVFIAPGSVIENTTTSKVAVPLPRPGGGDAHQLQFGETVVIDANGEFRAKKK